MKFKKGDILRVVVSDRIAAQIGSMAYVCYDSGTDLNLLIKQGLLDKKELADTDNYGEGGDIPKSGYLQGKELVFVRWLHNSLDKEQSDGEYFVTHFRKIKKERRKASIKKFFKQNTISKLDYLAALSKENGI